MVFIINIILHEIISFLNILATGPLLNIRHSQVSTLVRFFLQMHLAVLQSDLQLHDTPLILFQDGFNCGAFKSCQPHSRGLNSDTPIIPELVSTPL